MEVSRPGPLVIPSAPPTPELPPELVVPPSPQPVVEFPEDEVQLCVKSCLDALTFEVPILKNRICTLQCRCLKSNVSAVLVWFGVIN